MAHEIAEQPKIGVRAVKELGIDREGLVESEAGPATVPAGPLLLPQLVP